MACVEGRGRISLSGLTKDNKMGSCAFQIDVPHLWITQRQVGLVSAYCDGVGCHVLCLRHWIPVWQHSTTATSRYDLICLKATLKPQSNKLKQTNRYGRQWMARRSNKEQYC